MCVVETIWLFGIKWEKILRFHVMAKTLKRKKPIKMQEIQIIESSTIPRKHYYGFYDNQRISKKRQTQKLEIVAVFYDTT